MALSSPSVRAAVNRGCGVWTVLLPLALGVAACGTPTRTTGPAPAREAPRVAAREQEAPLPPPPEALAALLRKVPLVTSKDRGISDEQAALAKAIQAYGAAAVPYLLPLLSSPEPHIRYIAGFIVSDIGGLTEKNLDALIAAVERDGGWVPSAIAHIGTPRAMQYLLDALPRLPKTMTQVTFALETFGPRASIPLAQFFERPEPVSAEVSDAICRIFRSTAADAAPAVGVLLARAHREQGPRQNRVFAIRAIGCMGIAARAASPALKAVAALEPRFAKEVDDVLVAIGAPEGVAILVAELRNSPDVPGLRTLARLGGAARDAGPAVAALVSGADRELRVPAARTLGFIGYDQGAPLLMGLLTAEDDWQLPYVAAESLARLGVVAALPALDTLATSHWYPPVRSNARRAAEVLRGRERYPAAEAGSFDGAFNEHEFIETPSRGRRPTLAPDRHELSAGELRALSYVVESLGQDGMTSTPTSQIPDVGLKTTDGFLVGSSRGEWRGELMHFTQRKGSPTPLLRENIVGIHATSIGIVIVTGLARLAYNRGALYLARRAGPGKYEVTYWKTLPGAPRASGLTADGALFVSCVGGDLLVKGSRIEMAGAAP
ncbi:MAG: HEAT repeat domain-containing protein [Myxococcales bacterium]|nr:HEAT repeat domain-containing protein [Myxococcales bacterium]